MDIHAQKAKAFFQQGYNCAQAVLLAFGDETGLPPELAARLASSFGGGMGRMREVCGTLSGAFMAAGVICGYSDPAARTEKAEHYARIQRIAAAFRAENGSILCRELLRGPEAHDTAPTPDARTAEYYRKRPCVELVGCAAEILARELARADEPHEG